MTHMHKKKAAVNCFCSFPLDCLLRLHRSFITVSFLFLHLSSFSLRVAVQLVKERCAQWPNVSSLSLFVSKIRKRYGPFFFPLFLSHSRSTKAQTPASTLFSSVFLLVLLFSVSHFSSLRQSSR
jgi:hypothetical protein